MDGYTVMDTGQTVNLASVGRGRFDSSTIHHFGREMKTEAEQVAGYMERQGMWQVVVRMVSPDGREFLFTAALTEGQPQMDVITDRVKAIVQMDDGELLGWEEDVR
jgi:hypothetical protein